jgi:hypothetical protein
MQIERDRPVIEVTSAMVEAGVAELCEYDVDSEFASDAVKRIFLRMLAERPSLPVKGQC